MTTPPNIFDLFTAAELDQALSDDLVRIKEHPDGHLRILNYAEKAQYTNTWNAVTLNSRGLIFEAETGDIVARPFPKFFNFDQVQTPTPAPGAPMVMSTKFDGSLGIMYWRDDRDQYPAIATRGSFTSDQAKRATRMLASMMDAIYESDPDYWAFLMGDFSNPFRTYLFEIIYPENRIVVDYKGAERLVLLDVIDNETGHSDIARFDQSLWPDKAEKKLVSGGFYDTIASDIPRGEEGFVLYWPGTGVRAKVKDAEYIELHRIVTGLSEKSIWEQLKRGISADAIKEKIPDELFNFVDITVVKLWRGRLELRDKIISAWDDITGADDVDKMTPTMLTRKDFALRAQKYGQLAKYLFLVLDGQEDRLEQAIWDAVKPVGDTRAFSRSEDVA